MNNPKKVDPTVMLRDASDWWAHALKEHLAHAPKSGENVVRLQRSGAQAVVVIEVLPTPQIVCGLLDGERFVPFHTTPLAEKRGPAN